jgi:hypothetical protein
LRSPAGEPVVLATRRAEAVIAALVVNRHRGVSRDQLIEILWPEAPGAKAKANLRQTLSIVRKACPDFFEVQGLRCRIVEGCSVESDYDQPSLRSGQVFMPGMQGEWFEAHYTDEEPEAESVDREQGLNGAQQMLRWFADNDPTKMLGLMRECPALFEGLTGSAGQKIIDSLPRSSKLAGWAHYFTGRWALGVSIALGERHMRAAAFEATKASDHKLLVYSLSQLLVIAILSNKLMEARTISSRISEISSRFKNDFGQSADFLGKALISLHSGSEQDGHRLLAHAQDACNDTLEAASLQALRAFFYSTYGQVERADELLTFPTRVATDFGHAYIGSVCDLTRLTTMVKQSSDDELSGKLVLASDQADKIDNSHFKIYIKESVAMRYLRAGNRTLAARSATEV